MNHSKPQRRTMVLDAQIAHGAVRLERAMSPSLGSLMSGALVPKLTF